MTTVRENNQPPQVREILDHLALIHSRARLAIGCHHIHNESGQFHIVENLVGGALRLVRNDEKTDACGVQRAQQRLNAWIGCCARQIAVVVRFAKCGHDAVRIVTREFWAESADHFRKRRPNDRLSVEPGGELRESTTEISPAQDIVRYRPTSRPGCRRDRR